MTDATAPTEAQIVELASAYFEAEGVGFTLVEQGIQTGDGRVFGLEPLRRRLAAVDASEWESAVRTHFALLRSVSPEMPETFQEAVPHLRSAVIEAEDLGLFDGALMERPLVASLGERLMVRRGSLGMTVTREVVRRWSVDEGSVWAQARSGSLWDEPFQVETFVAGAHSTYDAIRGGRWTSTQVLAVKQHLGGAAPYGALVMVPARDEVLVHRICDDELTDVAMRMLSHTADSHAASPLPVCRDLFWWDDGALHRIAVFEEGRYRHVRVPEFSRMVLRLEDARR